MIVGWYPYVLVIIRDGDVQKCNVDAEIFSGITSSPLLFNNEGSMLKYFRAMVSDPDKRRNEVYVYLQWNPFPSYD